MWSVHVLTGVHLEKSPRGGKSTSEDIWGGGGGGGIQWAIFNFEGLQFLRGGGGGGTGRIPPPPPPLNETLIKECIQGQHHCSALLPEHCCVLVISCVIPALLPPIHHNKKWSIMRSGHQATHFSTLQMQSVPTKAHVVCKRRQLGGPGSRRERQQLPRSWKRPPFLDRSYPADIT